MIFHIQGSTENINNMTIACNQQGFWEADFRIEDQTCVNKQDAGGCEYIFIPDKTLTIFYV